MNGTAANSIILDIGMNIGGAALYFLERHSNSIVYGFEPFKPTFERARKNLEQSGYYPHQRVQIFNYGFGGRDEEKEIVYNEKMSCGQSTDEKVNQRARDFYINNKIVTTADDRIETIKVRQASRVIAEIRQRHPTENMVLKMDCEGAEYAIFEDLEAAGLLGGFKIIMLEWHYSGSEALEDALARAGYSYWSIPKSLDMGLIYACKG
ncbi:MAG: FkbM family methyltransferase [Lachnospiraceae bacterium]|jgi:FkbM family methyltransferase|nr:FkbM family methyltransferase [Lachnospiraceae bacterium]